jgi:hypothetical protein
MNRLCADIRTNAAEVLAEWERLVREQPWYSLPPDRRIGNLQEVLIGLVEASLCEPRDLAAQRAQIEAACTHGVERRTQGVPEHLIFTEYHLLRQAIWYYLVRRHGTSDRVTEAIMRIDSAMTLATNASLWGYHREEIEALGKWDEGIRRILDSSPLSGDAPADSHSD